MFKGTIRQLVFFALFLFTLAGCGGNGDSNTNGQLTLAVTPIDLTGGLFSVTAVATYVNASHVGGLQGFPIQITMTAHKKDGTVLGSRGDALSTDLLGVVTDTLLVPQVAEVIYVDVTASSGGLSFNNTVPIPSIAGIVSSPQVVAFPLDSLAGATQTVTISGGLAPYQAQIDANHIADIKVSINGNSIILTKLKNSVTNGPAILATLTVTDSSNATPIAINVSYN